MKLICKNIKKHISNNKFRLLLLAVLATVMVEVFHFLFYENELNIDESFARRGSKIFHEVSNKTSSKFNRKDSAPHLLLVIVIISKFNHTAQRNAIRDTWMQDTIPYIDVKVYFIVAVAEITNDELILLKNEQTHNGDLLFLEKCADGYNNLANKVLQTFCWIDRHLVFDFAFKGDDDTYIVFDKLYSELQQKAPVRTYWGFFDGRAKIKRHGPWAESNWILCDRYLPHARGGGYVLSSDLIHYLSVNADILQKFNSEDVSVGTWLGPLMVNHVHDPRFDTEYVSRGCDNRYIVTHKKGPESMRNIHQNYKNFGYLCSSEFKLRNSYIYNWNVPPSLCCIRNDSTIP